jgi:hypothetical protein
VALTHGELPGALNNSPNNSGFNMADGGEAGELRLVLVEKEARIVTLEAENAAVKAANAALRKEKAAAAAWRSARASRGQG